MLITREELALHRLVLDRTYPATILPDVGDGFGPVGTVSLKGAAELAGADIRVHGHITTVVGATCDRCMAAVELPVEQDFDLLYRPVAAMAPGEEIEVPADELEVGFYSGDGVNLLDVLREQVILALPMKVICRTSCRGLCPVCGANLNDAECKCRQHGDESPFASSLKSSLH